MALGATSADPEAPLPPGQPPGPAPESPSPGKGTELSSGCWSVQVRTPRASLRGSQRLASISCPVTSPMPHSLSLLPTALVPAGPADAHRPLSGQQWRHA